MRRFTFAATLVAFALVTMPALMGQEFDSVTFTGVEPDVGTTGTAVSHTLSNSDILESIVFTGTITEINTATFGSEVLFDYFGSGLSGSGVQLSATNGFTGSVEFEGAFDVAGTSVTAGDSWMYTFFEDFDDGSDGAADASVDVTFSYRSSDTVAVTSDLGSHTLNEGFYDRGTAGGDEDHPFIQVAFEVDADGIYQLDAVWDGFDGYLYLFDEMFTGDDTINIAFDDDNDPGTGTATDGSQIGAISLDAGTTYYAVLTTFGANAGVDTLTGDFSVTSAVGNNAFIVAIPEPASGLIFGLVGLGLMVRRRR